MEERMKKLLVVMLVLGSMNAFALRNVSGLVGTVNVVDSFNASQARIGTIYSVAAIGGKTEIIQGNQKFGFVSHIVDGKLIGYRLEKLDIIQLVPARNAIAQ